MKNLDYRIVAIILRHYFCNVWYGEDCPTTCTTCWCECGRGTLSLEVIIEYVKKNVKSNNI